MSLARQQRKAAEKENREHPRRLTEVPRSQWPSEPEGLVRVWRSRDFLVQAYIETNAMRLSVCRTTRRGGRWQDGITWDDLQRLKAEAGFGDAWAVELFPPDDATVNVANMRHLWLLKEPPDFGWRSGGAA